MLSHRDRQMWAEIERHLLADPDLARLVRQAQASPASQPRRRPRGRIGTLVTFVLAVLTMVLCAVLGLVLPALVCAGSALLILAVHGASQKAGGPGGRSGR